MNLININMKEFKELIYPEYLKLFPKNERKSLAKLNECFKKDMLKVIKITDNDCFIGFIITNSIKDIQYLQLDYFAILPEYQNKGYGSKALKLLKENNKDSRGIFIEVEKLGLGKDKEENELRKRRTDFYEKLGFYKLNLDLSLYNVIYTPYILGLSDDIEDESKIIDDIFKIYIEIVGKENVEKHCKIIRNA